MRIRDSIHLLEEEHCERATDSISTFVFLFISPDSFCKLRVVLVGHFPTGLDEVSFAILPM